MRQLWTSTYSPSCRSSQLLAALPLPLTSTPPTSMPATSWPEGRRSRLSTCGSCGGGGKVQRLRVGAAAKLVVPAQKLAPPSELQKTSAGSAPTASCGGAPLAPPGQMPQARASPAHTSLLLAPPPASGRRRCSPACSSRPCAGCSRPTPPYMRCSWPGPSCRRGTAATAVHWSAVEAAGAGARCEMKCPDSARALVAAADTPGLAAKTPCVLPSSRATVIGGLCL